MQRRVTKSSARAEGMKADNHQHQMGTRKHTRGGNAHSFAAVRSMSFSRNCAARCRYVREAAVSPSSRKESATRMRSAAAAFRLRGSGSTASPPFCLMKEDVSAVLRVGLWDETGGKRALGGIAVPRATRSHGRRPTFSAHFSGRVGDLFEQTARARLQIFAVLPIPVSSWPGAEGS